MSLPPAARRPEEPAQLTRVAAGAVSVVEGRPPVRFQLARTLDELQLGMLVHVDERGQVRSPSRYRALMLADLGVSLGAAAVGTVLYATFFGPIAGGLAALLLGGAVAAATGRRRRVERIAALVAEGRHVEAEALCRRLLAGRFAPARVAAAAHQGLSVVAARRGDFDEALREVRAALALSRRLRRNGLMVELLAYSEITLLVNLGRVGEARTRLVARGAVPDGDYLRILHWGTDLAVQFAEGRLQIDEDELWARSRRSLELSGMPHLIALCAWGCLQNGDAAMSDHLVAEAIDRETPWCRTTFPALWSWVEERRAPAPQP